MNVLVTGGAGYIGSHAVQRLLRDGATVVALDNLFRGHKEAMDRLAASGTPGTLHFVHGDVADREKVLGLIREHGITCVMHFAALAYVGESVTQPLQYYRGNTVASLNLLEAIDMADGQVDRLVFSSTCASYGEPGEDQIPIKETCPQSPINPYGASKLFFERILKDYAASARLAGRSFAYAALRYFNVAGSDRRTIIGEHHEPETHLIPVVLNAALGKRDGVTIHGTDYPTPDGTCIRDYVHVEDLIDAHVAVLGKLQPGDERFYNLGIGRGYSVREIIDAVRRVTGKTIKVSDGPRRPGDPPRLFADPTRIRTELGWTAKVTNLDEIVDSAWRWFKANPEGYRK